MQCPHEECGGLLIPVTVLPFADVPEVELSALGCNRCGNDWFPGTDGTFLPLTNIWLSSEGTFFSGARQSWKAYSAEFASSWVTDVRGDVAAEVGERLAQADFAFAQAMDRLDAIYGADAVSELTLEWFDRKEAGTLDDPEFNQRYAEDWVRSRARAVAWPELSFYTEAFYTIAWRLVEVLNQTKAYAFEGFAEFKDDVRGIVIVRNHLLQHPEKYGGLYNPSFTVPDRSIGPVLKSTEVVLGALTGTGRPPEDTKDQGLIPNATELRGALQRRVSTVLSRR